MNIPRSSKEDRKVLFRHRLHYITQISRLSSLTGRFSGKIFILFLIKFYSAYYACKYMNIMV